MEIAGRIREARIARGLKQSELAELLGVTRPAIVHYESGLRSPDLPTLRKIAKSLMVPLAMLLGDSADPTEEVLVGLYRELPRSMRQKMLELMSATLDHVEGQQAERNRLKPGPVPKRRVLEPTGEAQ